MRWTDRCLGLRMRLDNEGDNLVLALLPGCLEVALRRWARSHAERYAPSMTAERGIPFDTWETTFPERLDQGVTWRNETSLAMADIDYARLLHRFGEPHAGEHFLDGIGPMKAWTSRFPCGCELAVWEVEGYRGRYVSVLSNDPDIDHVLHHFALPTTWRIEPKDAPLPNEPWSLFRQDDNGNRFHIRDFDSRFSADCARREFEGRGHKQLYTIEKR